MAGEWLPERFSPRSQLGYRWTEKCFETARGKIQNTINQYINTESRKNKKEQKRLKNKDYI
jgi:hypothetical protein